MLSRITAKGQTTVPKGVRDKLKLKFGDDVAWTVVNGHAVVRPKNRSFRDIAGILYDPNRKPVSIKEESEAVMDAVAQDVMRSMHRER